MSPPFDATLSIELKRSPSLIAALAVMHLGAFAIAGVVPMAAWTRIALISAIALSAAHALIRYGRLDGIAQHLPQRLRPRVVEAIEWNREGNWSLRYAQSPEWLACEPLGRWWQPWLVILRLRVESDGHAVTVLVPSDAAARDAFRRLRARLRWQSAAA